MYMRNSIDQILIDIQLYRFYDSIARVYILPGMTNRQTTSRTNVVVLHIFIVLYGRLAGYQISL